MKKSYKKLNYKKVIAILLGIYSLTYILPIILLFSISFSSEWDVVTKGFRLLPENPTLMAYRFAFKNSMQLISSYVVTIAYSLITTTLSIIIMVMAGYALSIEDFAYKKFVNIFLLITMFVSGGLVPTYIINTQVYHLQNNPLIYLTGGGVVTATTIFIFRTFFQQLPKELKESAALDGANNMQIMRNVIIPTSMPIIVTYWLFGVLGRWNDYEVSLYYITDTKYYSLQFMLQQILKDADNLKKSMQVVPGGYEQIKTLPNETLKFAICIISIIPLLLSFPFFQRFFSKGMMVGSVKG